MNIESLVSNQAGVTAPVGELSTYSLTYAKDVPQYHSRINQELDLYVFKSKNEETGDVPPNQIAIDLAFEYVNWMIQRQVDESFPGRDAFLSASLYDFSNKLDNLVVGNLVAGINGNKFPTYVSFKCKEIAGVDNRITVWLADQTFRDFYDEYQIEIIPPFDVLDDFFQGYANVVTRLGKIEYTDTLNRIANKRGNNPETVLTAEAFDFVNPANPSLRTVTNWSVLIYGRYGNDADAIKLAIADYIMSRTAKSIDDWKAIFPDIFKNTEFIFFPRWKNVAIAEMTLQTGIYSPVMRLRKELDYLKNILPFNSIHVDTWSAVMSHPYKSLQITYTPNPDNRDSKFDLLQAYPDLLTVSSTSLDYNRMSPNTKDFIGKFNTALFLSETSTPYSELPLGYRKIERAGLLYVSFIKDKVRYLINTKTTSPDYPA